MLFLRDFMLHGRPLTTPNRLLPPCNHHLMPPHDHLMHLWGLLTPLSHSYMHLHRPLTPFRRLWCLSGDI